MFDFDDRSDDWMEGYCIGTNNVVWPYEDGKWASTMTNLLDVVYFFQDVTQE